MVDHLEKLELIKKEYKENENRHLETFYQKFLLYSFFEIFSKSTKIYLIENINSFKKLSKYIFSELKKKDFL